MQNLTRTAVAAALLTLAAGASAGTARAQQGAPALSGQWEMNTAKSDFGAMPAPAKASMTVEQSTTVFKFTQVIATPEGDRTISQEIPLTTADSTWTAPDGQPVTSHTAIENGALVISAKLQRQGMDLTQTSRWSVSPDGKALTLAQQVASPMGAMTFKLVFDKK